MLLFKFFCLHHWDRSALLLLLLPRCPSCVDSAIPGTVAHQAPLSMGFPRQESWSEQPLPPPGDLPNPGIKHVSPMPLASACGFSTTEPSGEPPQFPDQGQICTPSLKARGLKHWTTREVRRPNYSKTKGGDKSDSIKRNFR